MASGVQTINCKKRLSFTLKGKVASIGNTTESESRHNVDSLPDGGLSGFSVRPLCSLCLCG